VAGHGYDEVTDPGLAYKVDAGVTETKSCKTSKCVKLQLSYILWGCDCGKGV